MGSCYGVKLKETSCAERRERLASRTPSEAQLANGAPKTSHDTGWVDPQLGRCPYLHFVPFHWEFDVLLVLLLRSLICFLMLRVQGVIVFFATLSTVSVVDEGILTEGACGRSGGLSLLCAPVYKRPTINYL